MSSTPHPKRRRIDSIGTGIHKPFVSPLKRATSTSETSASPQATPLRNSNLRNVTTPSAPSTPYPQEPEVLAVQQEIRHLEVRIRQLRAQNAILQQATAVKPSTTASTTQPGRLEAKWRKASQAAAEEVFADFAARIRDNGGYTAFLKHQRAYQPYADQNDEADTKGDEEDWRDEMGDTLTARGKKQRRRENEDEARGKERNDDEEQKEQEEQELGLGSMLHVLNIPPEVIGWDEKEQAWK